MSDKKYPGFYKSDIGELYLYCSDNEFINIHHGKSWAEHTDEAERSDHKLDKNITREYLANTYGEVKNERHAEFIKAFAEDNGFDGYVDKWFHGDFFHFDEDADLSFYNEEVAKSDGETLITIPEPPEDWNMPHYDEQAEEFEMKQKQMVVKENGDNLHFGGEDKCEEWPCVGGEAILVSMGMTEFNRKVLITYIGDGVGCYKDLSNNAEYTFSSSETVFKKPKTPEEELRDKVYSIILQSSPAFATETLLEEFNITKKPQ